MGIFGRGPGYNTPTSSRQDRRRARVRRQQPHHTTRQETERRVQRLIIAGMVLIALAVVGIGVFGYYKTNEEPKREAVLRVGDHKFDMGYMKKRVSYTIRNATPGEPALLNAEAAAVVTINGVEEEELNKQSEWKLDISVSDDEIEAKIREKLRLPEDVDTNTYAESYREAVRDSGLNASEFREVIAAEIREDKIRQNLRSQIGDTTEQIRMRDIRVVGQEQADQVLARLAAGEDFAAIAAELSQDLTTKSKGGEMDWMPRASLDKATADAVFALEVGQRTQAIPSSSDRTLYIYEVLEKADSREITPEQRTLIEEQSYSDWQETIRQEVSVTAYYYVLTGGQYVPTAMYRELIAFATSQGAGVSAQP